MGTPSGFSIDTLRSLALSPLVDDESAFNQSFPEPVVLLPISVQTEDTDQEGPTPRHRPTRAPGAKKPSTPPVEAYYDAAIMSLRAPRTTIGRASTNDIPIPTGSVSSRHGQFRRARNGKWVYTDVGSTNGSTVRRKPAPRDRPIELDNGAEITVGSEVSCMFLTPAGLLHVARIVHGQLSL